MKENEVKIQLESERRLNVDLESGLERIGNLREVSVGKQQNIDRTRYIPLD